MIKVKQADEYVIAELIKSEVEINYDKFFKDDLIKIAKVSRNLYKNILNENKKLKNQLQNISNEFLKYDWKTSNKEQIINQQKNLYNSIFRSDK